MGSDPQSLLQLQHDVFKKQILEELNRTTNPPVPQFLRWCAGRFVLLGENENTDFVQALVQLADAMELPDRSLS